jgi:hypothetical protein
MFAGVSPQRLRQEDLDTAGGKHEVELKSDEWKLGIAYKF